MKINATIPLIFLLFAMCAVHPLAAQENDVRPEEEVVSFNEKVHDFGDLLLSDKSVSCKFEFTNISKKPIVVHNVVSSCGCTVPEWTKEPVRPGGKGVIEVTYKNDQGAYPFSKSITAYISGVNRPVILHIKGVVYDKKLSLKEMYTNTIGGVLGTREKTLLIGNMLQGKSRTDATSVANLSKKPIKVEVVCDDPALSVTVSPNPVPAGKKATLSYTVNTALGEKKWGRSEYVASFVIDGKKAAEKIKVEANIAEDFDNYTTAMKEKAPVAGFDKGYLDLGEVEKGTKVDHTIVVKNTGKSPLIIYKADSDDGRTGIITKTPVKIAAGKSGEIKIKYDTSTQTGEFVSIVTLTTNSPLRPRLDFFINGWIR